MTKPETPFRYFNSSPEAIRLVVLLSVRFPLSLRNVEDLLFERGIEISHETARYWWNTGGTVRVSSIPPLRQAAARLGGLFLLRKSCCGRRGLKPEIGYTQLL
jgi:putative transposase